MYAVRDIEIDHIVGTYNGIIGTQMSVDLKDDSMFNIGWTSKGEEIYNISTEAKSHCNIGRYFNTALSEKDHNLNMKCIIGLLENRNNIEIRIVMVTVKNVKKGDELLWFYGHKYL